MSRSFTSKPPPAYLRLCEIFSYQDREPTGLRPRGELARVLAACRPGGVFLCLGGGAADMGAWVVDGMDLSSRLVVVVQDGDEAHKLPPVFGDDLRITVHVQDPVAFLGDVRDHRFDLITELSPGPATELSRLALARLAPGAVYMTRHSPAQLTQMLSVQNAAAGDQESAPDPDQFVLTHLAGELDITLVARGPQRIQPKRRGGRRSRQGITPLFSTRTPSAGD